MKLLNRAITTLIATVTILTGAASFSGAQGISLTQANQIKFTVYKDSRGRPYIEVAYTRTYTDSNGEVVANQKVNTVYDEERALQAGYTQDQVDMILNAMDFIESSVYAVNNLPEPTPTPAPTPTPSPSPSVSP